MEHVETKGGYVLDLYGFIMDLSYGTQTKQMKKMSEMALSYSNTICICLPIVMLDYFKGYETAKHLDTSKPQKLGGHQKPP